MEHTFVICAYGDSPFLEACIQSCLNQSSVRNQRSKVILYTSTPSDKIEKLCQHYGIEQFVKTGGGIGIDWNNALSVVATKYATIAHQDDLYLPEYGEAILSEFDKKSDINLVFTDYCENDAQNQFRPRHLNLKIKTFGLRLMSLLESKWYQRRIYAFGNFICCPAVSYNLERLSDFQFDTDLKMVVDWDAWERIMNRDGKVKFISKRLMVHRIHQDSETTVNTENQNRELEERMMYLRYWPKPIVELLMKYYVKNQKANE
ncbi:glycosyltransferase [Lactococcus raffinolactis]|uniref:Glycosyltransferase n=1 Tax=Pseudolactococcus raffinolactis TaxID=1366 RepID=A0AAE6YJP8_9LACT|nr:glycosyltransferase family A protein [Lactococcus raffinolactis]QIW57572.1 glycosyltransferase [Lactococcus raffinolactis]